MPIYEYKCRKCSHQFELMQRFDDKPVTRCPKCSGRVDKLISHSAFHLKGSGWYATDYGKGSSGRGPDKKKSENAESKDSGEKGKEDSKP